MNIIGGATRVVTQTADAATAAAGAVGGAAINGVIGGVRGTATGIRDGLGAGSHSTPAALLTLGAIGAAGLVEWPILLTIGGTALLVHQFSHHNGQAKTAEPESSSSTTSSTRRKAPAKAAARASASRPGKATRTGRR